jgi:hypothetical protein
MRTKSLAIKKGVLLRQAVTAERHPEEKVIAIEVVFEAVSDVYIGARCRGRDQISSLDSQQDTAAATALIEWR